MTNKKTNNNVDVKYGYYSKLLCEPFDTLEELKEAEEAYYAKQKAKEDAAAQKKADAQKVDEAFKALNAARKAYKEDLTQLTKEYAEALENLKKTFEHGKRDIKGTLAAAEEAYEAALKEFTEKYDQYHLTLKDGDFETTIEKQTSEDAAPKKTIDLFDLFFGL
jgi:pyruvate/2-oxoglutarate dehydrogenase complex dihydrolipoamide acyltransferase (E2) component